jgi:hypothetical protein
MILSDQKRYEALFTLYKNRYIDTYSGSGKIFGTLIPLPSNNKNYKKTN